VTVVLGLLYVSPIMSQLISDPKWRDRISRSTPQAGLAIQVTKNLSRLPIGPWAGLGVLALYVSAALLAGGLLFRLRDV
jgi:ABC-2 type transport system permease protein